MTTAVGCLIPGLPDDVALSCLARVPRGLYGSLKLVCRSWCAAIEGSELYTTRSHRKVLSFDFLTAVLSRWFVLPWRGPRFVRCVEVVGRYLLAFGTDDDSGGSYPFCHVNKVAVFDSSTGAWSEGPPFPRQLKLSDAIGAHGKVVLFSSVIGRCVYMGVSSRPGEVVAMRLTTTKWTWTELPSPSCPACSPYLSFALNGDWHIFSGALLPSLEPSILSFHPSTHSWSQPSSLKEIYSSSQTADIVTSLGLGIPGWRADLAKKIISSWRTGGGLRHLAVLDGGLVVSVGGSSVMPVATAHSPHSARSARSACSAAAALSSAASVSRASTLLSRESGVRAPSYPRAPVRHGASRRLVVSAKYLGKFGSAPPAPIAPSAAPAAGAAASSGAAAATRSPPASNTLPALARQLLPLTAAVVIPVAATAAAFAAAGFGERDADRWFRSLDPPSFAPPDWLLAATWTVLQLPAGAASWMVWRQGGWARQRGAMEIYLVQLAVGLLWPIVMFRLKKIDAAAAVAGALTISSPSTFLAFYRASPVASLLYFAMLVWLGLISAITYSVWTNHMGRSSPVASLLYFPMLVWLGLISAITYSIWTNHSVLLDKLQWDDVQATAKKIWRDIRGLTGSGGSGGSSASSGSGGAGSGWGAGGWEGGEEGSAFGWSAAPSNQNNRRD
ncbi:unnamed protein product [Closterium sp. Yama58-4]|nr:unnamed protein product [Closterium sp. Yama58-4]